MTLGNKIACYRKEMNITQEALAQQLNVSNQAVSKWELDQCCPDILLLPKLADIFQISLDQLFDRDPYAETNGTDNSLPWSDDGVLRAVLYIGTKMVKQQEECREIQFTYEGPAINIYSDFTVNCGNVDGDIEAEGDVNCNDVKGDIEAGGDVNCNGVEGDIEAGGDVNCNDVKGDIEAGGDVNCYDVEGDVGAAGDVYCEDVYGDIEAGGNVDCGDVEGDIIAGGDVECGDVGGNVSIE